MAEIDKEAFMAAVVHDMRAPLNACLMSLSLIELKASQPAEVLKAVEVIRRNLERQAALIDDLGDALQMVERGLELEREAADLVEIAETAAQAVSAATDIEIGWAGARPQSRRVSADPERLGRAIGTLLEIVAAEAQPGGRIELASTAANDRVRIDIRGADAPLVDGEGGARRKRPVMRLTVAREIVAKHGGGLELDDGRAAIELPA